MMVLIVSLFMFRIIRKYNNEYDQNYIHYRTSNIGSNEYLCYKPEKEQHPLHKVLKTQNIKYSKKIMELGGMDLKTSNMTVIYDEMIGKTQKVNKIFETSKTYKANIKQLEKIRENGIISLPEHKTRISASNIWNKKGGTHITTNDGETLIWSEIDLDW